MSSRKGKAPLNSAHDAEKAYKSLYQPDHSCSSMVEAISSWALGEPHRQEILTLGLYLLVTDYTHLDRFLSSRSVRVFAPPTISGFS